MKKREITKDTIYSNGKGRFRKVLDRGEYPLYSQQEDRDCVAYFAWKTTKKGIVEDRGVLTKLDMPVGCLVGVSLSAHDYVLDRPPQDGDSSHGRSTTASFATWAKFSLTEAEFEQLRERASG